MRVAAPLVCAAVAATTMSCVLVTPPQYDQDGGVNPPPYILSSSATPPFETSLSYNELDTPDFQVTVGDADVSESLKVRFCLRQDAQPDTPYLFVTEQVADVTPDHQADRKPIVASKVPVCQRGWPAGDVHFIYVVVTDGTFQFDNLGCAVTPGSGADTAFWRFTCDKPL